MCASIFAKVNSTAIFFSHKFQKMEKKRGKDMNCYDTPEYKQYEAWEFGLRSRFGQIAAGGIVDYLMSLSTSIFGGRVEGPLIIAPKHPRDIELYQEARRGFELMRKIPVNIKARDLGRRSSLNRFS